jgi:hypothetical protein
MSESIFIAATSIDADHVLTERLRADADFDARWAIWQSRGRSHNRTVRRRLLMLAAVAAVGAAGVFLLLIR